MTRWMERALSRWRLHREIRGGIWFQTVAGHWVQGVQSLLAESVARSGLPHYVGIQVDGSIQTTRNLPDSPTTIGVISRDDKTDVQRARCAFEGILEIYLRTRGLGDQIPTARTVR